MLSPPSTSASAPRSRSVGREGSMHHQPAQSHGQRQASTASSSSHSVGQRLQSGYRALQVKAKSSWLDLRQRSKQQQQSQTYVQNETSTLHPPSASSGLVAAAPATTSSSSSEPVQQTANNDLLAVQGGEERRGSGGTLKAGRWIIRSSRSRPSSSGSGATSSASPTLGSWGRARARREREETVKPVASSSAGYAPAVGRGGEAYTAPMGPSPSNTAHVSPAFAPLEIGTSGATSRGISSLASFAFPGSSSSSSAGAADSGARLAKLDSAESPKAVTAPSEFEFARGDARSLTRRASEAPHCTCPTAVLRRHSELPAGLPAALAPAVEAAAAQAAAATATSAALSRATSTTSSTSAYVAPRRRSARPSGARAKLLAQLASWDFCSLDLSVEELQTACELLFDAALNATLPVALLEATAIAGQRRASGTASPVGETTLAQHLGITPESIRRFIAGLAELYHSSNAYHNFHHAADVLQALYALLVDLHALPSLDVDGAATWDPECSPIAPLDALALLFAAIGHDAGHPGLSNAFLANAQTPLATAFRCPAPTHVDTKALGPIAQRMPEGSPLESYHSLLLEGLIRRCGLAHLAWANTQSRSEMGDVIRSCVLATDMAIHAAFVTALENVEARMPTSSNGLEVPREQRVASARSLRMRERCERTLHCAALLKCADVSNPIRVRGIGRRWSVALRREWERQSALEEECALPLTVGVAKGKCCRHGTHDTPLPSSSATDDEGLRRTSAAHMVARVGGGGGAAADAAEASVLDLKAAGELDEERALARGQVAFVRLFVTPLLAAMTRVLPELARYATYARDNELLWAERLGAVEALLSDSSPSSPDPDASSSPTACLASPRSGQLTALGAERLRVSSIFLPPELGAEAGPDAHAAAQRLVHRVMEEALTTAMRAWSHTTALPEGQLARVEAGWTSLDIARELDAQERLRESEDDAAADTTLTPTTAHGVGQRRAASRAASASTAPHARSVSTTSFASSVESLASSPATAYSNASASTAATSSLFASTLASSTTTAAGVGVGLTALQKGTMSPVALPSFDDSSFVEAQRRGQSQSSPPALKAAASIFPSAAAGAGASPFVPTTAASADTAAAREGEEKEEVGISPKTRRKSLSVVRRFAPWSNSSNSSSNGGGGGGGGSSTAATAAGAGDRK